MATKVHPRASFDKVREIASIYTGGKVACCGGEDQLLVTAAGDTVHVTDLRTGAAVHAIHGAEDDTVTSFAVRRSGIAPVDDGHHHTDMAAAARNQLVTASRSLLLTLWDLGEDNAPASAPPASKERSWKAHEAPVLCMEFDPSGVLLATGSADSTVKVWDVDRGAACTHNLRGHSGIISALKFHPDGARWLLFTGADDCQVRVWDLRSRQCVAVLDSHVSVVRGLDVAPDGWQLLSAARDKVACVWDLRSYKLRGTVPILEGVESIGALTGRECAGFLGDDNHSHPDPDELFFFTAGEAGRVRVWRVADGMCVWQQPLDTGRQKHAALVSAYRTFHSGQLVTVAADQTIALHSLADMQCVQQIVGYNEEIIDAAFVGARRDQLAVITNTEQVRLYNLRTFDCQIVHGHSDTIVAMDVHRHLPLLATASKDNTARVWQLLEQQSGINKNNNNNQRASACVTVAECIGHTESVGAVAWSARTLSVPAFLLTASQDRTVKKWNTSTMQLSPDSDISSLVPQQLQAMFTIKAHDKDINDVSVAPNDKLFATASQDRTAKLWSVDTGAELATLKGHKRGVWSVRFSPVDQVLATASGDKTVKLWSLNDFACVRTFEGHTNSVLRVEFITAGTQLLSAGSDGLTKLWTIKTSECETTLDDHDDKIWALAVREPPGSIRTDSSGGEQQDSETSNIDEEDQLFSDKSCLLVSGGGDSTIVIYKDVTVEALRELHAKEELRLLQDQALQNFIANKDYKRAILLALELDQPARLCSLFSDVLALPATERDPQSILGTNDLDRIIVGLGSTQIQKLLEYIRTWNTNAKNSRTAQTLLHLIVKRFAVADLIKLPKIKELLDGIIPYSERHYARMDALLTQSWLIDYSLSEMDSLMADMDIAGSDATTGRIMAGR